MRKPPRYKTIEEAEELLRRGYFTDNESRRISNQINRDFDPLYNNELEITSINNNTPSKKWWQFWK